MTMIEDVCHCRNQNVTLTRSGHESCQIFTMHVKKNDFLYKFSLGLRCNRHKKRHHVVVTFCLQWHARGVVEQRSSPSLNHLELHTTSTPLCVFSSAVKLRTFLKLLFSAFGRGFNVTNDEKIYELTTAWLTIFRLFVSQNENKHVGTEIGDVYIVITSGPQVGDLVRRGTHKTHLCVIHRSVDVNINISFGRLGRNVRHNLLNSLCWSAFSFRNAHVAEAGRRYRTVLHHFFPMMSVLAELRCWSCFQRHHVQFCRKFSPTHPTERNLTQTSNCLPEFNSACTVRGGVFDASTNFRFHCDAL